MKKGDVDYMSLRKPKEKKKLTPYEQWKKDLKRIQQTYQKIGYDAYTTSLKSAWEIVNEKRDPIGNLYVALGFQKKLEELLTEGDFPKTFVKATPENANLILAYRHVWDKILERKHAYNEYMDKRKEFLKGK